MGMLRNLKKNVQYLFERKFLPRKNRFGLTPLAKNNPSSSTHFVDQLPFCIGIAGIYLKI